MESAIPVIDMVIRLLAAVGLASLIGIKRESHNRPVGLRTHMLVSIGAAIWVAGAIGVACGIGNFILAGLVTTVSLVIAIVVSHFEKEFIKDCDG